MSRLTRLRFFALIWFILFASIFAFLVGREQSGDPKTITTKDLILPDTRRPLFDCFDFELGYGVEFSLLSEANAQYLVTDYGGHETSGEVVHPNEVLVSMNSVRCDEETDSIFAKVKLGGSGPNFPMGWVAIRAKGIPLARLP